MWCCKNVSYSYHWILLLLDSFHFTVYFLFRSCSIMPPLSVDLIYGHCRQLENRGKYKEELNNHNIIANWDNSYYGSCFLAKTQMCWCLVKTNTLFFSCKSVSERRKWTLTLLYLSCRTLWINLIVLCQYEIL